MVYCSIKQKNRKGACIHERKTRMQQYSENPGDLLITPNELHVSLFGTGDAQQTHCVRLYYGHFPGRLEVLLQLSEAAHLATLLHARGQEERIGPLSLAQFQVAATGIRIVRIGFHVGFAGQLYIDLGDADAQRLAEELVAGIQHVNLEQIG